MTDRAEHLWVVHGDDLQVYLAGSASACPAMPEHRMRARPIANRAELHALVMKARVSHLLQCGNICVAVTGGGRKFTNHHWAALLGGASLRDLNDRLVALTRQSRSRPFSLLARLTLGDDSLCHAIEDLRIELATDVARDGDSACLRWRYRLRGALCVVQHAWGIVIGRLRSAARALWGHLRT